MTLGGTAAALLCLVHSCTLSHGSADAAAYALPSLLSQVLHYIKHGCMIALS